MPAIRWHEDIAPHFSEKDLTQRDAVAMIPAVSVEHKHRWPCCRKLLMISASMKKQQPQEPMAYLLIRPLIRLYRRLADAQNGPLQQQECLDLDIVRGCQLEVGVRDGKVGRDGDVW